MVEDIKKDLCVPKRGMVHDIVVNDLEFFFHSEKLDFGFVRGDTSDDKLVDGAEHLFTRFVRWVFERKS